MTLEEGTSYHPTREGAEHSDDSWRVPISEGDLISESSTSDSLVIDDDPDKPMKDTGFPSKRDPDFTQMTSVAVRSWIRAHNYSPRAQTDEVINTMSHLFSAILALLGSVFLVVKSVQQESPSKVVGFVIYGCTLVFLFGASTLHHGVGLYGFSIKFYRTLRMCDHYAIFFLIAGTFTPACLICAPNSLGASILAYVWFLCIVGSVLKRIFKHAITQNLFNAVYLLMGWTGCLLLGPLRDAGAGDAVQWLIWGGLAYTIGVIPFAAEIPNPVPGTFCSHELWHIFVSAGAACHFRMMWIILMDVDSSG